MKAGPRGLLQKSPHGPGKVEDSPWRVLKGLRKLRTLHQLCSLFAYLDRRQVEEPGRSRCRGRRRRSDRREGHRWPILEQAQSPRRLVEEEHGSSLRQRRAGAVELDIDCIGIEVCRRKRGHNPIVLLWAQTNADQERFQ